MNGAGAIAMLRTRYCWPGANEDGSTPAYYGSSRVAVVDVDAAAHELVHVCPEAPTWYDSLEHIATDRSEILRYRRAVEAQFPGAHA